MGAILVATLLLLASPGNAVIKFLAHMLGLSAGVLTVWRLRRLASMAGTGASTGADGHAGQRFAIRVLFWIVVAVALFFVFKAGR